MLLSKALRTFLICCVIVYLMATLFFAWLLAGAVKREMVRSAESEMGAAANLLREHIYQLDASLNDKSLPQYIQRLGEQSDYRFLILSNEQKQIASSENENSAQVGPIDWPEINQATNQAKRSGKAFSAFANGGTSRADSDWLHYVLALDTQENEAASSMSGFVCVSKPSASINATIGTLQKYTTLFVVGLSAISACMIIWFSTKMMRPLNDFADAARNVQAGQYGRIPSYNLRGEWGKLADAFNQMQIVLSQREDGLKENSSRLEAVLSSMIEGVIALDRNGTVTMANGAACRMFSLLQPELVGQKLLDKVRFPKLVDAVTTTLEQRTFSKTEFKTLGSTPRTIRAQVSVLDEKAGKAGVAIVLHDATELIKLENMRQEFVANISHELKTPLASIRAYAETLKLGALDDPEHNVSFVERIEAQADILNQQIQDLIQLARVESAQTSFEVISVEARTLIEQCIQTFSSQAKNRQIELTLQTPEEPIWFKADFEAVKTILNNLISNALHYTPAGGKVSVLAGASQGMATIKVTDTGIGIAEEHQARIFERFYRVDKARSRDMGGTGLGLAIVKHLAQAFDGNVDLESAIGQGSTFMVHFPLIEE